MPSLPIGTCKYRERSTLEQCNTFSPLTERIDTEGSVRDERTAN